MSKLPTLSSYKSFLHPVTQMEVVHKALCTGLLQLTSNQLHNCGHPQHQAPPVQDSWVSHKPSSFSHLSKIPVQQVQSHQLLIAYAQSGTNCRVSGRDEWLSWHERTHMLWRAGKCSNELLPHGAACVFEQGLKVTSCGRYQAWCRHFLCPQSSDRSGQHTHCLMICGS